MEWLIPLTIKAPLRAEGLRNERPFTVPVRLGRPRFSLATRNDATHPLETLLQQQGFTVDSVLPGADRLRQGVAPPWRALPLEGDHRALELAAEREAALALGLLERPRQPVAPRALALPGFEGLGQQVVEALAFALVDLHLNWDRRSRTLEDWCLAVRTVLRDRAPLPTIRRPKGPALLVQGYDLLTCLDQLRDRPVDLDLLESAWTGFADEHPTPPLAFELAFWSEATYRLSEQGHLEQAGQALQRLQNRAEALIARLPGLKDDLDGGMWWHHLGRLAYYDGDFAGALNLYVREWRFRDRLDTARRTRLARNLSGLLNDMGYLEAAEILLRPALEQQRLEDDPETFKSLGRLGEILLRQGRVAEADETYRLSWEQQDTPGSQTATYRGHTALMAGDLEAAEAHYSQGEELDQDGGGSSPYLRMGEAALALRRGRAEDLDLLWEVYGEELNRLRGAKTLPGAVVATARFRAGREDPEMLRHWVGRLIQDHYVAEALYPLTLAWPDPISARDSLQPIEATLSRWAEACREQWPILGLEQPPPPPAPTPDNLLRALADCRAEGHWQPLQPYRARLYPFNLLETP